MVKARNLLLGLFLIGIVLMVGIVLVQSINLRRDKQLAQRSLNQPMELTIRVALQTNEKVQAKLEVATKGVNWVDFTPDINGVLVVNETRTILDISEIVISFPTDRFGKDKQRVFRYDAGNIVGQDARLRLGVTDKGVCLSQPGTASGSCWEEISRKKKQEFQEK